MPANGEEAFPAHGPAPARRRLLLVADPRRLDSLTARRRVAAHLREMDLVVEAGSTEEQGWIGKDADRPDAALVCDLPGAAQALTGRGVPVVHLHSGYRSTELPAVTAAVVRAHAPAWLPAPRSPAGTRPAGLLAPARLVRDRTRAGCLLLVSAYQVPGHDLTAFADGLLRAVAEEAVRRTGRCEVVCDGEAASTAAVLTGTAGVRVHDARSVDVDALHAAADVFVASPTLTALTLAQSRRTPLALLPPLDHDQDDLARHARQAVRVPTVTDPADPALWAPSDADARSAWAALDSDDLRGAQRVARTLRQLALAPIAF
ncbi:CGA synthase-related protein [Streptomyces griseochromogenes]|uniref:CGA synthase-related protein n=1 Tax=Streptomyces griseochromogenes TaxID=68214 RepID=A0ABS4M3T7_9ACTN|nr:CGA synthase-related protein [Streptomyces griseochromogenes]MBP2054337.1 CGA synthase-related protein [Streptomyces griseochromogenes]